MPAILLLAMLLCESMFAWSQEYVYRAFRQPQGLEDLSLNALATDPQGFLWVATENGLYRFLGSSFHRYGTAEGILEQNVKAVFFGPDGSLWAGTDENLYRWNGRSFGLASTNGIQVSHANDIAAGSPGELLVLSKGNLHRLRYQQGVPFSGAARPGTGAATPAPVNDSLFFTSSYLASHPDLEHIGGFAALPDGTLWMACGRKLCSWRAPEQGGSEPVLTEWNESSGVTPDVYSTILLHRNGSIWAAGGHHILELSRGGPERAASHRFVDHSVPASAHNGTYDWVPLAIDARGNIITSVGIGIDLWDGRSWRNISKDNGLSSTHMRTFLFDAAGDLWAGSNGHGLYQWLGYQDWEGWTERKGLPSSNVWSVGLFEQERALVGTEQGPASVDPATGLVTAPFPAESWKYGQVTGMVSEGNGSILAGTSSGAMLRIQQHPDRISQIADLQSYVYEMFQEPTGRTFVLTRRGVFDAATLKEPKPVPVPQFGSLMGTPAGAMAPNFSNACLGTGGSSWFINKHGLVQHTFANNQDLWTRPDIDGLPTTGDRIRDVTCDPDGSLWMTVNDSTFWHAIPEKSQKGPATRLKATQLVLPEDSRSLALIGAVVDSRGWLWIGTDDGLLAFNGSTWRHLTQESGLIWNDCNENRLSFGPDGSLWIGTSGGLGRIRHPEHIFADRPPRIAMVEARHGAQELPLTGTLDMPWSRLDLSFQFAAPEVLNRTGLVFDYRTEGLEDDWVETRNETAHFQSLPPGSYHFQVYAHDLTSGIRSETLTVDFKIEAPWWRTRWFYALCSAAAFLCIVLLLHLRTKRLLAQQRHLERLVQERTSELEVSREELRRQATHDALTGLLNRSAMLAAFRLEMGRSVREGSPLTLVLGDIDHFKRVNDTYGHLAGDEALRHFASMLGSSVRDYDHVGRYGGEEFLILLVNVGRAEVKERLAALHASISDLTVVDGASEFTLTCSLGAVCMEPCDLSSGNPIVDQKLALSTADEALYRAKRSGRNRVIVGELGELAGAPMAEVPMETV
ncbi:diguanylate cyclase [Granulicella aggregans]|jgi:diguanylate cyclase (GGDEF)-like protein|uniref:diguanylate cyclase n=1 Tax=Granulicella aggregans TaxID=474949 RepID=UPI0021DF7546|nr:diguanylate cyclase [Granulicella aggregans]